MRINKKKLHSKGSIQATVDGERVALLGCKIDNQQPLN